MSRLQPRWAFALAAAVVFYLGTHVVVALVWGAGA